MKQLPAGRPSTAPRSTIRFRTRLGADRGARVLRFPASARAKLPRAAATVEATLNGFPFRATLESDGNGGRFLRIADALHAAAGGGSSMNLEIMRVGDEPTVRLPADLGRALRAAPRAAATWAATTPAAQRDWILWIGSGRQAATRGMRVARACSMLAAGKRRVCCFGGLGWLRKDHPRAGAPWRPLPTARH